MYGLNDKPSIWVVDDDKSIRWVLDKALQKSRLPYRMFADGREVLDALDFWNNQPENKRQAGDYPALLLSDIRMPDVNGIELLRNGYFGSAVRTHFDIPYTVCVCLVMTLIALALVRDASTRVEVE